MKFEKTSKIYAMKIINKDKLEDEDQIAYICSEKTILTAIDFPFIVPLRFAFQTSEKLFLVMDYINGGELFTHIRQQGCILENQAKIYIAEIILALEYLHNNHIIHRDLKPENVLLDSDGHIVITDFGLATMSTGKTNAKTICGTTEYMAPEMIKGEGYNESVDIWSLGALSFELFTGKAPFIAKNKNKLYDMILNKKPKLPPYLSPECNSFLKGLLEKNVNKRLGNNKLKNGISELKNHLFFKDIDWEALYHKQITPPIQFNISEEDDTNFDKIYTESPLPVFDNNNNVLIHPVKDEDFAGFSYIHPGIINLIKLPTTVEEEEGGEKEREEEVIEQVVLKEEENEEERENNKEVEKCESEIEMKENVKKNTTVIKCCRKCRHGSVCDETLNNLQNDIDIRRRKMSETKVLISHSYIVNRFLYNKKNKLAITNEKNDDDKKEIEKGRLFKIDFNEKSNNSERRGERRERGLSFEDIQLSRRLVKGNIDEIHSELCTEEDEECSPLVNTPSPYDYEYSPSIDLSPLPTIPSDSRF